MPSRETASRHKRKETMVVAKANSMAKTNEVHIGEYSEGHLLKLANKLVDEKTAKTRVFGKHAEADVPHLDKSGELERRISCVLNAND